MGRGSIRNSLCKCGSGLKTKKCHPKEILSLLDIMDTGRDVISRKFLKFYESNSNRIEIFRKKKFDEYLQKLILLLGEKSSTGNEADLAVNNALKNIVPANVIDRLAEENIYYWMALDRRLMPINGISRHFDSPTSVILAKTYMSNLLYMFSSTALDQEDLAQDVEYSDKDYMLMYELEVIAVILQKIGLLRRISSKGGKIFIEDGKFGAISDDKLRASLKKFDHDNEKLGGWAHIIGLKQVLLQSANDAGILDKSVLIFMRINGGETKKSTFANSTVLLPHCTLQSLSLSQVYALSSVLDEYFIKIVGVDFLTWLKCLSIITTSFLFGTSEHVTHKLFKTAYTIPSFDALEEVLKQHPELTLTDLKIVLEHATRKDRRLDPEALLDLKNPFFVHKLKSDGVLIDGYFAFSYFQRTIIDAYQSIAHKTDGGRGLLFEKQTAQAAIDKGLKFSFPPGFEFIKQGDSFAEVDLSIEHGSFMILLDCKSLLTDIDASEGDYDSLTKRTKKLRELLSKRDTKAQEISSKPAGDNYKLTAERCLAHIISADNEWVPVEDPFFWWKDGIPRVSTLEKFVTEVLPHINTDMESPYVYKITSDI